MKMNLYRVAFLSSIFCAFVSIVFAQGKTESKQNCQNYNSNNAGTSFSEAREITVPAGNLINVDALSNGNISLRGEKDRKDVLIRACVKASATSFEAARNLVRGIRIETAGLMIRADSAIGETNWSVSYEILVPRASNLELSSLNGSISIGSVEGLLKFETVNGEVCLSELAGEVKGRTVNTGIHITLSGDGWKGKRLNIETVNGSIYLIIPQTYAARIESNTVNGSFQSNIAVLKLNAKEKIHARRFNADLNGGGATLRLVSINGMVVIDSSTNRSL